MNTKALNSFFKLRSKGRKLESKDYAQCLEKYFDTSRTIGHVTIPDLQNTLGQLQNNLFNDVIESICDPRSDIDLDVGEHVAVFWVEGDQCVWYLSIVDRVKNNDIYVAHFSPTRKGKCNWTFPDETDIQQVDEEQILKRKIPVTYMQTSRIRCSIEQHIVEEIEGELKKFI